VTQDFERRRHTATCAVDDCRDRPHAVRQRRLGGRHAETRDHASTARARHRQRHCPQSADAKALEVLKDDQQRNLLRLEITYGNGRTVLWRVPAVMTDAASHPGTVSASATRIASPASGGPLARSAHVKPSSAPICGAPSLDNYVAQPPNSPRASIKASRGLETRRTNNVSLDFRFCVAGG